MSGPLSGVTVLDLTNVLAGPFCCYQLALMGAKVIKIEVPGRGDLARELGQDPARNRAKMGASFVAQNAGKTSLTLNLKSAEGRAIFERLVANADIVVENFRPGVMDRLGLGWRRLSALKPAIVYGAISGFGQTGPLRSNPAYDQIVQGLSGVMSITGDAKSAPLRVGFPVADTMGGITAAFAITAALVRARATGRGEFVDVSMLDSMLSAMAWAVSNWLLDAEPARPMGNENVTASPSGTFATAAGLLNIAANKQEQFEELCRLIDKSKLIDDPRFCDREVRKQHRQALHTEIEAGLGSQAAREWARILNAHGIPAGEVLEVSEILEHPQIVERDFVHELETGDRVATGGYRLGDKRPIPNRPPPELGANTNEILQTVGYTLQEIERFREQGIV